MTGFGPSQAPPQGQAGEGVLAGNAGEGEAGEGQGRRAEGGGLSRETETRDPRLGRRGGGGGLRPLRACQALPGV
jgi:hypothetical protein